MKPWVAAVEYLQPVPVSPHSVGDNRREHFSEYLDQRQRPVVGQADITAALVDVMDEIDVPRTWRHLEMLTMLHSVTAHSTQQSGMQAYKSGPLPESPGAFCFAMLPSFRRIVAKSN